MQLELDTFGLTAAILAVAGVVAFLAHRAKQPLIIAFILVGVIVGPSVLGWVSGDAEENRGDRRREISKRREHSLCLMSLRPHNSAALRGSRE